MHKGKIKYLTVGLSTLERFTNAVEVMATSGKTLRERLIAAHLSFHPILPDDMPDKETRRLYEELVREFTQYEPVASGGRVQATIGRVSGQKRKYLARLIVEIWRHLAYHALSHQGG